MKHTLLLVIAHPRKESFNYAIADCVQAYASERGYVLLKQDLYGDGFDPVLTEQESLMVQHGGDSFITADPLVQKYQQQLREADVLVAIHPNWWGKPPAMMSGWLDRVLAPGVAYKLQNGAAGMPEAALQLKSLVVTTGDTPLDREQEVFGDPLGAIWGNCVLPYIGSTENKRLHLSPVSTSTVEQRATWLESVCSTLDKLTNG